MRVLSIFFVLFFVLPAFSQVQSCLQNATDSELLREVELRMGVGGSGDVAFATYSCNSRYLTVDVVDQDGNQSDSQFTASNSSDCKAYASDMTQYKGTTVKSGVVVAVCDSRYLKRILISAKGKISSNQITLSNSSECKKKATEINRAN